MKYAIITVLLSVALVLEVAFGARFIHIDHYGVRMGTNYHYCSADFTPRPDFTCEVAQ